MKLPSVTVTSLLSNPSTSVIISATVWGNSNSPIFSLAVSIAVLTIGFKLCVPTSTTTLRSPASSKRSTV